MAISEKKKASNNKWDKANMSVLACKVQKEKAEAFRDYCAEQGKSVHAVLLDYVNHCLER